MLFVEMNRFSNIYVNNVVNDTESGTTQYFTLPLNMYLIYKINLYLY